MGNCLADMRLLCVLSPSVDWHIRFMQPDDDGDLYVFSVNFCGSVVSVGLSVTSFISNILVFYLFFK